MRGPDAIGEPDAGVAHAHARGLEPRRQAGQRGRRVERDRGVEAERPVARPHPRAHEAGVVVARHDDDLRRAPEPGAERAQHRLGDVHGLARAPLQQLHDVAQQHQPLDAVQRGEQRLQRLGAAQDVAPEPGAEVQIGDDERGHGRAGWWHSEGSLTKVRDMRDGASGAGGRRGDPAGAGLQPQRHAAHRRAERRVPRARPAPRRLAGAVGDRRRRHRPADPARAPRPRLGLPQPPRPARSSATGSSPCSPARATSACGPCASPTPGAPSATCSTAAATSSPHRCSSRSATASAQRLVEAMGVVERLLTAGLVSRRRRGPRQHGGPLLHRVLLRRARHPLRRRLRSRAEHLGRRRRAHRARRDCCSSPACAASRSAAER